MGIDNTQPELDTSRVGNINRRSCKSQSGCILATYISKSGILSVSGAGGFSGSAPLSGSSVDLGVSLGYRF